MSQSGTLAQHLKTQFAFRMGYRPNDGEVRSWERSLPVLAQDLADAGLLNVEVLVEYQLPLTSKRADAIVCGYHPTTGDESYVVVELKQWSSAVPADDDELVLIEAYGNKPVLHPVEQVARYATYLTDFVLALDDADKVRGCAYLHNARSSDIAGLRDHSESASTRMYSADERAAWLDFLRSRLSVSAPGARAADVLLHSGIRPSRKLMDLAAAEIRDREMFTLLDEQQVAYRLVLRAVERARASNTKTVVIVTGGPGSGKSVIALSLLGELSRRGYSALHATGSRSFTQTLRKVAGNRNRRVKDLFKYFNSFMDARPNDLEVLICDEAHRIRETSANRFTPAKNRTGNPQVTELVDAAHVPVFLLDEFQVVRPGELGTTAIIREEAQRQRIEVVEVSLEGQFRAGGSKAYDEWVVRFLGLADGEAEVWAGDDNFDLVIADSPAEMESMLASKQRDGFTARMTAGFCWRWSEPNGDRLPLDIEIDGWQRPWNAKSERSVGDAPGSAFWATEAGGFGQVGCVYTAQGFEYDWNGVILGPDLVWREGRLMSDVRQSRDPAFRGSADEFDDFVRNIYKVLLTRGMVGTVVYSTDAETRRALAALVRARA